MEEELGSALVAEGRVRSVLAECAELSERPAPDSAPFVSKYEARSKLQALRTELQVEAAEGTPLEALLGLVDQRLGLNFLDCEENGEGEKHLDASVAALTRDRRARRFLATVQEALNRIGVLWAAREEHEKAYEALERSRALYLGRESGDDTLSDEKLWDPPARCDELYTLTMFYLAQVHGHLGRAEESAQCCVVTLRRQLAGNNCDHQEWAANCIHLAAYYVNVSAYGQARHCLEAAAAMMPAAADDAHKVRLEIAWGKLYLARLCAGAKDFREQVARGDGDEGGAGSESASGSVGERGAATLSATDPGHDARDGGRSCELDGDGTFFEASGAAPPKPAKPIVDFDGARAAFKRANSSFERAKRHFVLDGYVTDHIAIVTDQSSLYCQLAVFERDGNRKVKMHRRRAAFLSPVVQVLNPSAFEEQWKALTFELGQIYSEVVEIKLKLMGTPAAAAPGSAWTHTKFSGLVDGACDYLDKFMAAFRWLDEAAAAAARGDVAKKEEAHDDVRRAVDVAEGSGELEWFLSAHFLKARLLSKVETKAFQTRSLQTYKRLLCFAESHVSPTIMMEELAVAREMSTLLSRKISSMRA